MKTLLYLSYGQGPHELEVVYSALSVCRCSDHGPEFQIVVYTDNADAFQNLPLVTHYISPAEWIVWAGPQRFNHRRKIMAFRHALEHSEDPVVLLDGDTWMRGSVRTLFDRVAPGQSVMHIQEGRVGEVNTLVYQRLNAVIEQLQLSDSEGGQMCLPLNPVMWNAGVIGLHPADASLLDEVLSLTDHLCKLSDLHVLEQFAFSHVLATRTSLREAADLVFHYWPPYLHEPFRKKLPLLMKSVEHLPLEQKIETLYAYRPRAGFLRRSKVIAKRVLQFAGLLQGQCRSNEW